MVSLQHKLNEHFKLYESLSDEELTPIYYWAETYGLNITNSIRKNIPSIKIDDKGKITSKLFEPHPGKKYSIKDLFEIPSPGIIKKIDKLHINTGGTNNCINILDANQYKYIPNCISELQFTFKRKNPANLDLGVLLDTLSNTNTFILKHISTNDKYIIRLNSIPKRHINYIKIQSECLIDIDNISGLDCDVLDIPTITNSNNIELININKTYKKDTSFHSMNYDIGTGSYGIGIDIPKISKQYSINNSNAKTIISDFLNRNNIKKLLINGHELIYKQNSYILI